MLRAGSPARPAQSGTSDALAFFYGLWATAALSRALYQYLFRREQDLTPTHISLFVGALYVLIIVGLRRRSRRAWWLTFGLLLVELAGVLVVGTIDVLWQPFPYTSVWSGYGAGYLYMPLILPLTGIVWMLRRTTREAYGARAGQSA